MTEPADVARQQQLLVELAHWLGRAMQYSPTHPSCVQLAEKLLATLTQVLDREPILAFGILKDNVMIGEVAAAHPAVRARIAAHLHDRGVLVLRFLRGVSLADLNAFIELLLLPVQTVFDRGGLLELAAGRGLSRIQVEELAHDISDEQLESGRRRRRLREFFADALRNLLARRKIDAPVAERLAEMLAHPEITVTILEDQGAGLAEAAAGMALMVQHEEHRSGLVLVPQLRAIFAALAPMARDRLVLGFPPLVGELRAALAWAMRGYHEDELARFVFPVLRARAHELEVVLYALSVLTPHDGTRLSTLRRVGLMLHDLPLDDAIAGDVLSAMAQPVDDYESYRRERLCLVEPANRALGARTLSSLAFAAAPEAEPVADALPAPVGRGAIREIVRTAARTKQFERFCRRLPDAAGALATEGAGAGLLELVLALAEVERPEWRELAVQAVHTIAGAQAPELLLELDRTMQAMSSEAVAHMTPFLRLIVANAPRPALEQLDRCESERLHKLLLELMPLAGARLVPLLRARLTVDAAASVVELIGLLVRAGGKPEDLVDVARHPEEPVRLEVVRALRTLPADERAMELVVRYLADPSLQVRNAVRILVRGELLGPTAIAGIGRLLADPNQPDEVQRRLVQALGQSHHDTAAQLLQQLLRKHNLIEMGPAAELRDLTAASLARCPAPAAARLFQECLMSSSRRIRKACERAAEKRQG